MDDVLLHHGWLLEDYQREPEFERNMLGLWVPRHVALANVYLLRGLPIVWTGEKLPKGTAESIKIGGMHRYPFKLIPTDQPGHFTVEFQILREKP